MRTLTHLFSTPLCKPTHEILIHSVGMTHSERLTGWLTYRFLGKTVEQRPRLHVAASLEVVTDGESRRVARLGPGHHSEDLLEHRLVAGNRERAVVSEAVLLLGFKEQRLEDGVVRVRRAHNEPPAPAPHADRHVAGWDVWRDPNATTWRCSLPSPATEHFPDPHNVPDLVAAPDRLHFPARYVEPESIDYRERVRGGVLLAFEGGSCSLIGGGKLKRAWIGI